MPVVKSLFFLLFLIIPTFSFAADNVQVRFGKHTEYERLVFEWPGYAPDYKIEENTDGLKIELNEPVKLDTSQIAGADSSFIKEFRIQGDKQIFVFLTPRDKVRDMRFGRKIVLDIYADENSFPKDEPVKEITESALKEETVIQEEEPGAGDVEEEHHASEAEEETETATEELLDEPPAPNVLEQAVQNADNTEPHALVLSSTDGIQIAVYRRFGFLWVLANRVGIPIEPMIEGSNPGQFSAMTRYEVADNTATLWQLELPDEFFVLGEGGSLYWRVVLSAGFRENTIPPTKPIRTGVDGSATDLRSGQVTFPVIPLKNIITYKDPIAGDTIKAVTVDTSEVYSDTSYEFVDFDVIESPVGLVFAAKNPDLVVKGLPESVSVYTEKGLILTNDDSISKSIKEEVDTSEPAQAELENRLYNFDKWQMGPKSALEENQRLLMISMRDKSNSGRAETMMAIARLNLSHGRGAEAKGLIENARSLMPQLVRSPQFQALRGAASHEAAQYDLAVQDLLNPALNVFPEINLWRSATLAHLGDWQQAIEFLPNDFAHLKTYPPEISIPLTITLTEVALRNGDKETGEMLLAFMEEQPENLNDSAISGIHYLQGEVFRQNGDIEEAVATWTKLSKQENPLYRTKAELALVALGQNNKTIDDKEAVDRLENLRFVWRGDDLEVQVLQQLGLAEIEAKQYVDGFKTLRDTVVLSTNDSLNDRVTNLMMETYENLFLTDKLETVSPLDAAMLYEEFRELTPSGAKGDKLVARLAERLVDANLLGRAVKLLAYQLDYRLTGEEAINTALRMASIQLMDQRADAALNTLSKAETLLQRTSLPNKELKEHDLKLLKARALSDSGEVNKALTLLEDMLPPSQDISRLSADIAWKSGRWNDAAAALRELVMVKEYNSEDDFTEEDAQLLLNYAITLNLSDQRITLRNIRERHLGQMQATSKGELFEVISRPRQNALLADRETLMGTISETEIFSDFLDSYKTQ